MPRFSSVLDRLIKPRHRRLWTGLTVLLAACVIFVGILVPKPLGPLLGTLFVAVVAGVGIAAVLAAAEWLARYLSRHGVLARAATALGLSLLFLGAAVVFLGRGCVVLGIQVIEWLKSGVWQQHTALETIRWVDSWFGAPSSWTEWANAPGTWLGFWKLFNAIPDSVFSAAVGALLWGVGQSILQAGSAGSSSDPLGKSPSPPKTN